ncbi:Peripheral-type benzodiazepine receptor-associated protein 1 [Oryzias melastigma]|uniref:RIMS-binding protein 2 n=1 Tax=Oryzias melastigma TaxID=30732 RepID=A0A834BVM3_ORYME|nr:Peripheral-type benzodiazepine receptor-associated protein 1 [Oryzias melastigma]
MGRSMERVMYDLCARSEQPEPADMESSNSVVALGKQQQQLSESEKPDSNKEVPKTAKLATKSLLGKRHHSLYANLSGFEAEGLQKNGTDYGFLVRQNSELLRALDELEKTCSALKEENGLLRKSSAPGTEEKVRRLRKKNTELAVLAKRLEERARKLQEANLRVVNSPSLMRPGSVEHYKRAFARQRARDLAHHADALLSKDKEIAALQQECRELEDQLGHSKGLPLQSSRVEFENLLRESQKEVLRLQRQLSVTSSRQQDDTDLHVKKCGENTKDKGQEKVGGETPCVGLDEAPSRCTKTPTEEGESWLRVTPPSGLSPSPSHQEDPPEEQRIQFLERELNSKRKECEDLEHEVKKRQRRCLDLESQLENERGKNEHLKEEADLLRRKALLLDQSRAENEELREELSEVTAQRNSVLEENQRLRAKLENLEQVLKHMREVAERRQQLELEHEQALAILKFKQDEIKRLQRAQLFAKREHEGVVQMLESKVRELEEKCRSQSEQFGLLSQELEKFRLQASNVDLASSTLLNNPSLSVLTNGVGLTTERDVAAALRMGATPHPAGLSRVERSPVTKHRELPTISVSKSASSSNKSETAHLTPKSDTHLSPHKSSPTHEVDTASEVEELDIDVAPAPYTASRGAAKLQVFIARYSYNPYDGPNDNPEVELPLTAGEYIYVYGDMDDDGFYEGELMDGRRGLVPSNFVERVSDDDLLSAHHPETGDASHNSLLDSSLHSASHQHHLHSGVGASAPAPPPSDSRTASSVPPPLTNGLDLDLEEVGVDLVPYPRKLTLIKQLAKSIIIGWDPPLVPAGWGNVFSYNVFVDQELRLNVPFGAQTKAVLERLDINLKAYRVSVQSLTEKGVSDQLRCSLLVGRDVCVAPTQLCVDRVTATSANLTWLPSNSNYVHIVSLNDEECELVKAGCYSLCLNNLLPSLQYTVKVEARPHRTPWELPVERREHRSATITFNTLMAVSCPQSGNAGPPDAPLDVQLEQGPSPGIALISWLPVTIDAAGTSNGVRVTGYSIYVDRKKVLEVSSPTAGSALLGPSQIQCLQAAQELTLRTMSAHGESCDSLPVKVPSKLAAIMAGPAVSSPVVPAVPCASLTPSILPPHLSYSAANISASPLPSDTHVHGLTVETAAKTPGALHSDHHPTSASYVMAWANPSAAAALSVCEATLPAPSAITPPVNITPSIISTSPQACPAAAPSPAPAPTAAPAPSLEPHRDADSPGTIRPFPSITDFMEDPSDPKFATPERIPTPPKAPITDLLNPQYSNVLRPPSTSPLESEVEEELENTRLVSIEEFLRQDQDPAYSRRQQSYRGGFEEPPTDYNADNSRSDLSDILEEEEEDLCSDHLVEGQARGYSLGANREPSQIPPAVAGPSWTNQAELSSKAAKQPKGESPKMKGDSDVRIFVALFPYDPATMSPNPDAAEEELPFSEGQIIKVYGDKDADGFYRGESGGHVGFVPCNMVSEIQVEDEETRQQLLQQGFLSTATSMEKIGTRTHAQLPRRPVPPPKPRRSKKVESAALQEESVDSCSPEPCQTAPPTAAGKPVSGARRMIAIFDYDPRESSPNTDIEAELTFSAGDVIHVFGDMDEDGFFYGDLNGHRGLVPSNFLQAFPDEAPAEAACAPPAPEPKKESQDASTEPQCSGPSSLEETLNLQSEVPHLVRNEPTPPDPATSTSSDPDPPPGPANVAACYSSPAPLPSDSPAPADCSAQAKKKKGFFSKGKKLFRKLGSSKKE